MRTNTMDASRRAQTSGSRCTIREFDDDHLVQELKEADVFHSETPTGVERYQPAGFTCVPMKQDQSEQPQQQEQGQQGGGQGGNNWNDNQPKGPSAEGHMSYLNGSRSHPMCTSVDDRRARPYGQHPGESQHYSADGSGQTVYHRVRGDPADGLYLVTLDDQSGSGFKRPDGTAQQKQTRQISIRHANKKKQRRTKQQQQGQRDASSGGAGGAQGELPDGSKSGYKHEGDSVNTEVQLTSGKINFNDGGGNVGYYDNGKKDWLLHDGSGANHSARADKKHTHIKNDGGHVWVQGATFKSMPFVVKPDPCS